MRRSKFYKRLLLAGLVCSSALTSVAVLSPPARAQNQAEFEFDLPAQPLDSALIAVGNMTRHDVIMPSELVRGVQAPPLNGRMTAAQALDRLVAGTGLSVVVEEEAFLIRGRAAATEMASAMIAEIVVTGSRIRGVPPTGSTLTTIDRTAIDQSGYVTVQQILQTLPQNYGGGANDATAGLTAGSGAGQNASFGSTVNLRGLGPASTLVLLDGNRPPLGGIGGTFADISMIPTLAIERIEVLADGASAIYGSDAVAGVVNIIPRSAFKGIEATARYGSADGDFDEIQAGIIAGTDWSGGHGVVSYEYQSRGRLAAADRDFATEDLRSFGGADYRQNFSNPGTIVADGRFFAIPGDQDGRNLAPSDLVEGSGNLQDGWLQSDILPKQERHSLFASVEQEVGDIVRLFAEGLYSERSYDKRRNNAGSSSNISVMVPTTNPFYVDPIGTGEPVQVRYSFLDDLGAITTSGKVKAYGLNGGARTRIGDWRVDLVGSWGRQEEKRHTRNIVNMARLAQAIADADPATSFNIFGDGSNTNPATIEKVRGSRVERSSDTLWSVAARGDGPLTTLPGGDVRLAIGAEYRHESFASSSVDDASSLTPVENIGIWPEAREVTALYGELLVPLVGEANARPGLRRLILSAAVRYEKYNDFGSTTNPKFGLDWFPAEGVRLRSTWGTSFRAPSFVDQLQEPGSTLYFVFPLSDSSAPSGRTNALLMRGNDPNMGPEEATTWTLGVDIEPDVKPDIRLSVTYFNIRYKDRIADPATNLLTVLNNRATYGAIITDDPPLAAVESLYASPYFVDVFGIPANAVEAIVDARIQNLSIVEQSGLDFALTAGVEAGGGRLLFDATATYLIALEQAFTKGAPKIGLLNTVGNPVDLRVRAGGTWVKDGLSLGAHLNFTDGYKNTIVTPAERVSSWTTIDAQIAYDFGERDGVLDGLRLALSATNLFDEDPPYVAFAFPGITAVGYDPQNASAVGRVVSVQLTKKW